MKYWSLALVMTAAVLLVARAIQRTIDRDLQPLTPWRCKAWGGEPQRYHVTQHTEESLRQALAADEDSHAA